MGGPLVFTRKLLIRSIGVLALTAAVTACGSSGSSSSHNTPATPAGGASAPSSAKATGPSIKVGAICTCSGPLGASAVASGDTIRAWAKSVNASGGLEGHPVDLIYFDDAGSPGMAATDAATLISDHVAAIVDLSFDSSAWAAPVTAAKIPVIGGEEDTVIYVTNPDFYSTSETQDALVYSEVALAKQAGAKSAGIVACAESPACASELPLAKKAGNQLGIADAYSALIPATAPS